MILWNYLVRVVFLSSLGNSYSTFFVDLLPADRKEVILFLLIYLPYVDKNLTFYHHIKIMGNTPSVGLFGP